MGQTSGNGYDKVSTVTPEIQKLLQMFAGQAGQNTQAGAEGLKDFLPGGKAGNAITNQANQNFQQQTIPSILNAFGTGNKGSSSLNQALASGGAKLNSDLASQLSQLQLGASGSLGSLGLSQGGTAASTPQFAYQQQQTPFWQDALLAALGAGGQIGGAALGRK
jgi:hypothetical protein